MPKKDTSLAHCMRYDFQNNTKLKFVLEYAIEHKCIDYPEFMRLTGFSYNYLVNLIYVARVRGLLPKKIATQKTCLACGTTQSYRTPNDRRSMWYHTDDGRVFLCRKCYNNHISNPFVHAVHNSERICYKTKQIQLDYNPRKGICSECGRSVAKGEIKKTNMHHEQYDDDNPAAFTVELCCRDHRYAHCRKR